MASVTIDNSDLAEMRKMIETFKGGSPIVIIRATNDTLSGVKTQSAKLIGAKVTATAKTIKAHFKVKKMYKADMSAVIDCTGKPLALIKYSAKEIKSKTSRGIRARILKAKGSTIIDHAFIATMTSGHKGAYWRVDNRRGKDWPVKRARRVQPWEKGHKYAKFRLPIHELYGPPIAEIYNDPDIINPVMTDANTKLQARLEYHTGRLIEQAR
jgi:hypothetical protein